MTTQFLDPSDLAPIELAARDGHRRPAHVPDRASLLAINAALATGRPLLVRGEPGMGKSQLAHAAAKRLHRALLHHAVDARTEPRDLLYTVDAVARLADAQVMGARGDGARTELALENYVQPGVLWWAFDWDAAATQATRSRAQPNRHPTASMREKGVVLLIDEIDKADSAIPNGLLDALGHRAFEAPGHHVVMRGDAKPLVIVTTNEERTLPDAFLRRCFVLHLELPDSEGDGAVRAALRQRGEAQFPGCEPVEILDRAAELISDRRAALKRARLPAPGVAEYIDLIDAVLEQRGDRVDSIALMKEIALFVLHKNAPPPPSAERSR